MIYLDNAATTYPKPECVYETLDRANRTMAFNAGRGSYKEAREVAKMIDETRRMVADLVHSSADKVYFESSATEAMNIIINGLDLKQGDTVYISPFEHNAVVRPLYNLKEKIGINIMILPFNKVTWEIETDKMNDMFAMNAPKACFLTHTSNVTGYILPIGTIFEQTRRYNCINIADCSQSLGVLNPDVTDIDFVVFAGHKSLYASFGVAGFINLTNTVLSVYKSGGTGSDSLNVRMPEDGSQRYEAGSLNAVAITGLHESILWLKKNDVLKHEKELTDLLIHSLQSIDKVKLYLPEDKEKVLGIVSFNLEDYHAGEVGEILAEDFGICARTGFHCAPFVHNFIGSLDDGGTVRISIGYFNTKKEIDLLINALEELINE